MAIIKKIKNQILSEAHRESSKPDTANTMDVSGGLPSRKDIKGSLKSRLDKGSLKSRLEESGAITPVEGKDGFNIKSAIDKIQDKLNPGQAQARQAQMEKDENYKRILGLMPPATMRKGGKVTASKRADGIAKRGKTRGRVI